jgi:hypothetical protein
MFKKVKKDIESVERKNSINYCERNKKYYKFPKGEKRNLNLLDVNGKMLFEKKMLMDTWKECFKGKITNHGLFNKISYGKI